VPFPVFLGGGGQSAASDADNSAVSYAKVENDWFCTSTATYVFMDCARVPLVAHDCVYFVLCVCVCVCVDRLTLKFVLWFRNVAANFCVL
jgi:hypothetical protein